MRDFILICFTGVDGAGKTTQAQQLVRWLNEAGYPAVYSWSGSRSPLTRPFTKWIKGKLEPRRTTKTRAAATVNMAAPAERSSYLAKTQRLFRSPLARSLWLNFTLYEHAIKIWLTVWPLLLRKQVVVCDRYLYDSVLNIALLSGVEPDELAPMLRLPPGCTVPRPTLQFFLNLPDDAASKRKAELTDLPLLRRRALLYRSAAQLLGMEILDATDSQARVTSHITERVQGFLNNAAHKQITALKKNNHL